MKPITILRLCVVFAALAGLAVLAGCGNSTDSSTGSSTGGAAAGSRPTATAVANAGQGDSGASTCGLGNGKPATGEPIPVGAIAEMSGGPSVAQGSAAAAAFYKCVNANGGINGRPIKFFPFDSAYNPQKAAQGADTLIQDDHVVAFAGGASFLDCLVNGKVYEKENIYSISGIAGPPECNNLTHVAAVDNGETDWVGAAQYAVEGLGAKKFAIATSKTGTIGDAVIAAQTAYAKRAGAQVVKAVKVTAGAKDATSVVLDLASAHPQAVVVSMLQQDAIAILKAAQAQGLNKSPKWVCLALCYSANLPQLLGSAWDGLAIETPFPLVDAKTPDSQLYGQVMAKYAPSQPLDPFSQGGFLAAKILTDTLLKMKGPITRETVGPQLAAIKDYKTDMLCEPWAFATNTVKSVRVIKMQNGGFVQAAGCQPVDLG